ncbi:hypothetical protein ACGFX4_18015 [Kitasatospora sp. NPDC048365]|uniref:hypothetical protein n=1 Tax=Kitasatospora sp. NPDC048365 TaxID=3364050 RepID=UPI00371C1405
MKRVGLSTAALAAAAILLAGCGSTGDGTGKVAAAPSPSADTHGCLSQAQAAAGSFDLTTPGGPLGAYYRDSDAGHAKVGIVFAPQAGGSLCDWQPHYSAFTAAGYAVLGYLVGGNGPDDLRAAITRLKAEGVTEVALVGASKGASAAIEVAADPASSPLPVRAVVSLSTPLSHPGESNAEKAVLVSRVPTFFAVEDRDGRFAEFAQQLHAAAVTPVKELRTYPGDHHGAPLLTDGALPDVQAFLTKNAPAR